MNLDGESFREREREREREEIPEGGKGNEKCHKREVKKGVKGGNDERVFRKRQNIWERGFRDFYFLFYF